MFFQKAPSMALKCLEQSFENIGTPLKQALKYRREQWALTKALNMPFKWLRHALKRLLKPLRMP